MSEIYIGLDYETTGTDPDVHGVVQIGLSRFEEDNFGSGMPDTETFEHDIRVDYSRVAIDPDAMIVHRISQLRSSAALPSHIVEELALEWLAPSIKHGNTIHPVGWNVGSFDVQFAKKYMPRLYRVFSHRAVDLTSLTHFTANVFNVPVVDVKNEYMKRAIALLECDQRHSAGWDARCALTYFYDMAVVVRGDKARMVAVLKPSEVV